MEAEGAFFSTNDYELTSKKLGEGSYGTVYVATNFETNEKFAAKLVNMDNVFDGREQMLFLRESLILHKLDHPSIVKFIGINFKSFSDDKQLQPTILTEYLPHGSLKDNLNKEKKSISDLEWTPTKKYINLLGISDAMRYLHEEGIAHRDLKPENILVDSNYYPRVCDFGLSKCFPESLTKSMKFKMTGQFGTPLYTPPEILLGEESYDQSVDVYAFGMIAYEIVTGEQPFSELDNKSPFIFIEKVTNGYRPMFKKFVTDKMQKLICRCWSETPSQRPTFKEIFEELSNDLTHFNEDLDEDEINDYLAELNESKKERSTKKRNKMGSSLNIDKEEELKAEVEELKTKLKEETDELKTKLKEEVEELKIKLSKYQNEHDSLSSSNEMFHDSIYSLLGPTNERNINKTMKQLKIASEQGNRYASFLVGYLYEVGIEIEQNISESLKYYDISNKQGNSKGLFRIGRCYTTGIGGKEDFAKAKEYYEEASKMNDANAINNLGFLYHYGKGVEQSYIKAKEYYEKAAELGHSGALFNLGILYDSGKGVEQNYIKAKEYYEKAAELCHSGALCNLGILFDNGNGVEKNISKAREYYEKAAELGHPSALYNLGILYKNGIGVKRDTKKAKEYFERAADLGYKSASKPL